MSGDRRAWQEMRARVDETDGKRVRVGIVGSQAAAAHGDSGATNGEIALYHEFGTRRMLSRPFIRMTFSDEGNERALRALQERLIAQVVAGKMTTEQALGMIGAWAAGAIRATIRNGSFAPLAPSTVARKGSSKPLVDTGQLAGAVSWVVES